VLPEITLMLALEPPDGFAGQLYWHHCEDPRWRCAGPPGLPDLFICGRRGALWAEVKPHRGARLRPDQTTWKYALLAAGQQWYLWTGEDLASGEIRRILEGLL
jgi:hypothetical protein